jgi:dTDP-L-rhamnose 4-epimerase
MKLLILGGAGMIGQAIAKRHMVAGDDVYIYDTFVNPYTSRFPLYGKLVDSIDVELYDLISNQAAFVGVGESMYAPKKYLDNNIGIVGDVIQSMIDKKVRVPIIHAGSMGPYGEGPRLCHVCSSIVYTDNVRNTLDVQCGKCNSKTTPIYTKEDAELHPVSIYGITKAAQEAILRVMAYTYDISVTSLRYFSVYSSMQDPRNPRTGVLSIIGNQIINRQQITLNEDGMQTRDLVHVDDVAEAHYLASRPGICGAFEAYNIGTGCPSRMLGIAKIMRDRMRPEMSIVVTNTVRLGDIRDSAADPHKARFLLDFKAGKYIEEETDKYCDFLLENKDQFRSDSWANEQAKLIDKGLQ